VPGGEHDAFGVRLRDLRERAGLTQEELAERAGLTAKAISLLERGERRRPHPHTVRSLAQALALGEDERTALTAALARRADAVPAPGLPVALTPLVGREQDVAAIVGLLGDPAVRLLTLTGTGGIGKTRLGVEAARAAAGHFPDGVAFVALAPLGDAALVVPTVARVLGVREAAGPRPTAALTEHLRGRTLLLVLDNVEHLLDCAGEVAGLLGACPGLSVLATSRAPLRVRGEREYCVAPLGVPPRGDPTVDDVAATPAGALFAARATDASGTFALTPANAAAVAAICRRLDGLPLALELAAATLRHLDPETLLGRLDRALRADGARDLPERQRTMRATLDWSHQLLREPEKELFRRLAVFAGGFPLAAAEEVCAGGGIDAEDVVALLGALAEQSLVTPGPGPRYRMLEPVRQYALAHLAGSGEEDELRRRHAEHHLALAERAQPLLTGPDQVVWLDRLEAENDNLRAAIRWAVQAGELSIAARLGAALGMYWVMRTRHGEGRLLCEQALAGADLPAWLRARVLFALAVCVYGSGDDRRMAALAEEGVALARQAGDPLAEAYALGLVGYAALQRGDLDGAERALTTSLCTLNEHGDAWRAAHTLNHLAVAALGRGDAVGASSTAAEALAHARRAGDRYAATVALCLLARTSWQAGEQDRAAGHWREALGLSAELANTANSAAGVRGLATVAAARGQWRRAARLLGAAGAMTQTAGPLLFAYTAYASNDADWHAAAAACAALGEREWQQACAEGRAMGFEQAVRYALADEIAR
jgi:predicted ATPase/transcriptional regulator with XRE-family HTH domain